MSQLGVQTKNIFMLVSLAPLFCTPIFNVHQKTDARYSYRLDVCLSVRPSVTRWYCVETAQPVVELSSLPDSNFMRIKIFPGIPMGTPPMVALNAREVEKKLQFPTNISL